MDYRPEIDGLRALSVVPVILFHAGFQFMSGGFVGVDIFFVISGYLITTIILEEFEKGKFSILNFYERRARRIIPILFVVVTVACILSWNYLQISQMRSFSKSVISTMTFSSNFLFWREDNYFDTASEFKPLLHTWTLSVEEQFYIFFPLLLILIHRLKKNLLLPIIILGTCLSLGLAQWASIHKPSASFFLLPTRAWELLLGSLAAVLLLKNTLFIRKLTHNNRIANVFSFLGLLLILISVFSYSEETPFPSVYTLLPTVGAVLIILFCKSSSFIGRILSNTLLVKVGLISYSAYLWHHVVFAFMRYHYFPEPSPLVFGVATVFILILSYFSWKYIEIPFRNRSLFSRKSIFSTSVLGSIAFILFGVVGNAKNGFPERALIKKAQIKSYQGDNKALQTKTWVPLRALTGHSNYRVENNAYDKELWFKSGGDKQKILLVGNSHSKDIFNILHSSTRAQEKFEIARFGCEIRSLTKSNSPFYLSPNFTEADIIMLASKYSDEDLTSLKDVLKTMSSYDKKIVLVKSIFSVEGQGGTGGNTLVDILFRKKYIEKFKAGLGEEEIAIAIDKEHFLSFSKRDKNGFYEVMNETIDNVSHLYPDVIVLDRMEYAIDEETQRFFSINAAFEKYYYDSHHHTLAGVKFFGKRIDMINWLGPVNNN